LQHISNQWGPIIEYWAIDQWSTVPRWNHYRQLEEFLLGDKNIHWQPQTTLEHCRSLATLAMVVIDRLRAKGFKVNGELILRAIHLHDNGERTTKVGDVAYSLKTANDDQLELQGFLRELGDFARPWLLDPYLLQFVCDEAWKQFAPQIQTVLRRLSKEAKQEGIIFKFLERVDYCLYAFHHWRSTGQPQILTWVLRNQVSKIDQLVSQLPALEEILWTPEVRRDCLAWLEEQADLPSESNVYHRLTTTMNAELVN